MLPERRTSNNSNGKKSQTKKPISNEMGFLNIYSIKPKANLAPLWKLSLV